MDILKVVGERIRTLRKKQGLSQEKLAEMIELSANYIGFIERGQRQVALDSLEKIADALGTDLATLFEKPESNVSPNDAEIAALVKAARNMEHGDLLALRRIAQKLSKYKK